MPHRFQREQETMGLAPGRDIAVGNGTQRRRETEVGDETQGEKELGPPLAPRGELELGAGWN